MDVAILTLLKLVLLAMLYVFLFRAVRAVTADLFGPRRARTSAPRPRPVVVEQAARRNRRPPREMVVHPPDGRPEVVPLERQTVTLGRSERMTVQLDDVYVSDEHALVSPADDGWLVRDLGSTNGTFLNGAKVTQPTTLTAGDQLRIGKTRIEVRR
ncbi:MAG TPA: FHA domain-containing protein [Nitriliruptorales bacterium]|nr:FHA domain-containing protein [Nitriliruptorales bacterium]